MNFADYKSISQKGKEEKIQSGSLIYKTHRFISAYISYALVRFLPGIRPNHISTANLVLLTSVLVSVWLFFGSTSVYGMLIQLLCLNLSVLLDAIDGEIARYKKTFTQRGLYYDLLYHFYYPIVMYLALGNFFFSVSGIEFLFPLSLFIGILQVLYVAGRKSRLHIRYKIRLEGNQDKIQDLVEVKTKKRKAILPFRVLNYLIFFIYDWTWSLFVLLALAAVFAPDIAAKAYAVFLFLSLFFLLHKILCAYPRDSLFTSETIK